MKYTVRYAHLEKQSELTKNQLITSGDKIGVMGNTGASNGAHLHIDCIEGYHSSVYYLWEMSGGGLIPAPRQLNYFIDNGIFKSQILITTHYNDPVYMYITKKLHTAYDIVPLNRHETKEDYGIHWNRSMPGEVLGVGFDDDYGYYVNIGFEA